MSTKQSQTASKKLVDTIVHAIQEKKGSDITIMDLKNIPTAICDYFVICHGNSDRQLLAIKDSIEEECFKGLKEKPFSVEGVDNAEWVLIDFVDVVAHVFLKDKREFFALENLWADAKIKEVENLH
jgi:ribosome-associated protein